MSAFLLNFITWVIWLDFKMCLYGNLFFYLNVNLNVRVGLGIATLLFYVPVPLASLHQCGALVTLSSALWLSHELKLMKALKHVPK